MEATAKVCSQVHSKATLEFPDRYIGIKCEKGIFASKFLAKANVKAVVHNIFWSKSSPILGIITLLLIKRYIFPMHSNFQGSLLYQIQVLTKRINDTAVQLASAHLPFNCLYDPVQKLRFDDIWSVNNIFCM